MQARSNLYNLFGFVVASELELPLPLTEGAIQVEVVLGSVPIDGKPLFRAAEPFPFTCYQHGDWIILAWHGARFGVMRGRVVVDAADYALAAHLLVPAVWSVVLSAHQRASLHGSVVERSGRAIATLGTSGSGKTTAALALIDRGWRLVTDDLLAFDAELRVFPGPPWVRILPEREEEREESDAGGKLRIHPSTSSQAVPLAAMIVLAPDHGRCVRLSGASAVAALLQQVYNPLPTHSDQAWRQFDLVHHLADRVPIYGAPPRSLTAGQLERIAEGTLT